MKIQKTEKFKEKVFNLVGNEYAVLGEYKTNRIKIKMKHVKCGFEWEVVPNNFLNGNRCPKCCRNARKTTERFSEKVYDLVGVEYEVLGDYKNSRVKIKIKHIECGFEYEVVPNNFTSRGARCPQCARKKTTEIFKKEVFDLVGSEYKVLGAYINANEKIKIKHSKCGHEYEVVPNSFLRGRRCPKCCNSKGFSKGEKELVLFVKSIYDGRIIENDRTIIPSMTTDRMYELDIFLPDLKLAIEYNGKYWHDKHELETPGYHAYKQRICDKKGIKLVNIDDADWRNAGEKIKKQIKGELKNEF